MKLGTIGYLAVLAVAGTIAVSVASSREPAPATPNTTSKPAATAPGESKPDNLRQLLDTFRSDLNTSKVRTLNQVMKMTPEEAAKFWPIYQRYETELNSVLDRRAALIKQFVELTNEDKLTNDNAATLSTEWLQVAQDRLNLWKKYNKEVGAAVSPIRAAQFLQVEHQISLLVDINIASVMPAVNGPAK
ncbi:MAG: hypothetical protein KF805_09885 [Phycisphaeraceae bacterium]|nr:hypothetical protein [Phycisphaeraceae bacterium]